MIRTVFDTNVIVSALLARGGAEAYALDLAVAKKVEMYVTAPILREYEQVPGRTKFKRIRPETIRSALARIRHVAIVVKPSKRLEISPDETDNRFIECAETSDADYLITGNKRHFPERWKNTTVIGASRLIEILIDATAMDV